MNARDEFAYLLAQLSDACSRHQDELVARANYYSDIDNNRSGSLNYFKQNPFVLEPVPNALLSILTKLYEFQLQNIGSVTKVGADELIEELDKLLSNDHAFIDKITPNINFLYKHLWTYTDCASSDERYKFFNYMGVVVGSKWLSFDSNRKPKDIPVLQANKEFILDQEIITLQIERLKLSEDERIKKILEPFNLPAEAKLKQIHIHLQFEEMLKQLNEYYNNIDEEDENKKTKVNAILLALQDHDCKPSMMIENVTRAIHLALPALEESNDTVGIKILKFLAYICTFGICFAETEGTSLARENLTKLSRLSSKLNFFQNKNEQKEAWMGNNHRVDKYIVRMML